MAHRVGSLCEDLYPPSKSFSEKAFVSSMEEYSEMYAKSIREPATFWRPTAEILGIKSTSEEKDFVSWNFNPQKGPIHVEWLKGAQANMCYSALDLNIQRGLGDNVAFYWEGNEPEDDSVMTYKQLFVEVCKFANVLKKHGVKKGDRVAIYMPMVPSLVVAMLACTRIGAPHSIVFGGFSSGSLKDRIIDSSCSILITADGVYRGTKCVALKDICDQVDEVCEPEWVDCEDTLFLLYTSGSTGKPKGVLHTTGGYMMTAYSTFKYVFDYHPGDIYWCTADIGWITGHTYVTYGPLLNGATSVLFEGVPTYPDGGRFWAVVDKYKVTQLYTAPTAIRLLMKMGDSIVKRYSRKSLKVLGTVGEPINPEAWMWYHHVVGDSGCPIVDTFWQTETGGHVITPLPGATVAKPGSATFPFFGVVPVILDENGRELNGECEGYLCFSQPWPGIMRTVFGDHERFETTYFKKFPGYYTTGDGARRDTDGYIWVTGRIDDMLNVSGHLLSTAEVESCLVEEQSVAESAVVSRPHPVKGECLYCFVTPMDGVAFTDALVAALKERIREKIGPFACPDFIQYAPVLPKTRSGKIMRRVLRKIAAGETNLGDVSTLADQSSVESLMRHRLD
ncbi:unnamed protein product [Notodromas monacha]|uniref:acetate--CoA ligase n=1 Tax=Notodromas monacha TaxID=399045 RepID=A0A7R9G8N6_9CRUS|nr:unnamed protein product [Notodromas monacha]CAG0913399.1 unnamed protein product [Notodromas monacha]